MRGDDRWVGFAGVWILGLATACGGGDEGGEAKASGVTRFSGVLANPTGAASVMWVNTRCESTGGAETPADCPKDAASGASALESGGGFTLELRKGYDFRLIVMTETGTVHATIVVCGQNVLRVPTTAPDSFDFGSCVASGATLPTYVPQYTPNWMSCD